MKIFIMLLSFAAAFALHAEDARPICAGGNPPPDQANCRPAKDAVIPLATVEQLTAKVADQQKENAAKDQTIAYLQRKLQMYQQGLFACQDAQIDAQAKSKLPPANSGASQAEPVSGGRP